MCKKMYNLVGRFGDFNFEYAESLTIDELKKLRGDIKKLKEYFLLKKELEDYLEDGFLKHGVLSSALNNDYIDNISLTIMRKHKKL